MQLEKRIDKLKEVMEESLVVPNVRDAVRGLPPGSSLAGPVEFYGERSLILPSAVAVRKKARNSQEERNMKIHIDLLRDLGVGSARIYDIPDPDKQGAGLVERLLKADPGIVTGIIGDKKLNFFINTSEAEELAGKVGSPFIGPTAYLSSLYNNKVDQRTLGSLLNGHLFPAHKIVSSQKEVEQAFTSLRSAGAEIVGKVGHLASGEGMEVLESTEDAERFWSKWSRVLESHNMRRSLIIEEKKKKRPGVNSVSTQFLLDKGSVYYIGPAIQYVNGFNHTGNRVGKEVAETMDPWVEEKMMEKSLDFINLGRFSECRSSIIGFDFIITDKDEVLMVECNFRDTASTLLFGLEAQLGSDLTYELEKIKFPLPLKYNFKGLAKILEEINSGRDKAIPLNPRLFEETGEMFMAIASSSIAGITKIKKKMHTIFS